MPLHLKQKRIRAFLHFKCFLKGGNCPDAFFRAQKMHPGISPFQMLLEGWELPRCVFRGSKNAFQMRFFQVQRMHLVKGDPYYHQICRMHSLKENKRIVEIPFLRAGTHDSDRTTHDHERTTAGS